MKISAALLLLTLPALIFCLPPQSDGVGREIDVKAILAMVVETLEADTNEDGNTDYILMIDGSAQKVCEKLDYNLDGKMDDFYYYINGVLVYREIDSNYDEAIDVKVYIREGVYIERYEQDADFNGSFELIKDFGTQE
ncbi:MAG: hypothetical protein KAU17_00385 [Spirochaetales bacterium]|nr:hypothetical protein [Spirochaetales bacterium]